MKQQLYIGQAPTTAAAAFTATKTTSLFSASVCNPTGSVDDLTVWLVPSGDTAADDTKIYHELSVAAGATVGLQYLINVTLDAGDAIHLEAGTSATALTVQLSGDVS